MLKLILPGIGLFFFHSDELHDNFSMPEGKYDRVRLIKKSSNRKRLVKETSDNVMMK